MMKVEFVPAEPTNAVFLTNFMGILSGIIPRNALSIETCWAPELAVNVLIWVCVTG
jgi:TRAP-type C4-dicarboxylate transport system permease small subunit